MGRDLYGIAEIAESLGLTRQTVTVWRRRRSFGMPAPDAELASGPVWQGTTIEPWIQTNWSRLTGQDQLADVPLRPSDVKRAGRRLFRLTALLLEEPPRLHLINQALTEVDELAHQISHATDDETRRILLQILEPIAALAEADPLSNRRHLVKLTNRLLEDLTEITNVLKVAVEQVPEGSE